MTQLTRTGVPTPPINPRRIVETAATVIADERDRKQQALDALFGVRVVGRTWEGAEALELIGPTRSAVSYRSLRQAYVDIAGRGSSPWDGGDLPYEILRESRQVGRRYAESLTTSSWAQMFGDSITRRAVAEYQRPALQAWRTICSSIETITDFRTQRLTRFGGYGTLPAVGQGAPYQPLTSPPDEEATYAPTKRGGTEDLTLEAVANDDLGAVVRIPVRLGAAAGQTVYRAVFDLLASNATCTYDSTALFDAAHGNTSTSALSQTGLAAARTAMMRQTAYGDSSDVLSIVPRFLVVPADLAEIAYQLTNSAVAVPTPEAGPSSTPNMNTDPEYFVRSLVVPYLSDTNNWYAVADPATVPTIEVGFVNQEAPEILVADAADAGASFSSDKVTFKVRHMWGLAVVDHRGFYRGAPS